MRVLDLYCGGGGAAMGLHRAWPDAEITGVDINPQKNYPFHFVQADAMTFPLEGYNFIWASPPCQAYSIAARYTKKNYPDLIAGTRARLQASGTPWVIENVVGAPIRADVTLCGCQFGLPLRRRRHFETSWEPFELRRPCLHDGPVVSVVGHGTPSWVREKFKQRFGRAPRKTDYEAAMDIHWMTRAELSQAIPPAYSEFLALQWNNVAPNVATV